MLNRIIHSLFNKQSTQSLSSDHLDPILQPCEFQTLIKDHAELVSQVKLAWSDEKTWKTVIEPTIHTLARFVGHLPCASQGLFADKEAVNKAFRKEV
jgi:hypothetical protein